MVWKLFQSSLSYILIQTRFRNIYTLNEMISILSHGFFTAKTPIFQQVYTMINRNANVCLTYIPSYTADLANKPLDHREKIEMRLNVHKLFVFPMRTSFSKWLTL